MMMEGQEGDGYMASMTETEVKQINDKNELILSTHLISCALELKIDEVCQRGLTVPCPACGQRSVKDNACTHMVCINKKCGTRYCYSCGKARLDCDGARPNAWSEHNTDWETNPQRCPMYLEWLGEGAEPVGNHSQATGIQQDGDVDGRVNSGIPRVWPDDPAGALALFHRERVLRELIKTVRFADQEQAKNALLASMGGYTFRSVLDFQDRPYFAMRVKAKTMPRL
jgi:hypothetical protein